MASDIIQSDYDRLDTIASRFAQQADSNQQLLEQMRSSADVLANGGWVGKGSDSFQAEMEGVVYPATNRLIQALQQSQRVTQEIVTILKQAEDEAAAPFRGGGGGAGIIPGGAPGGVAGGSTPSGGGSTPGTGGVPGGGGPSGGGTSAGGTSGGGGGSIFDNLRVKGNGFGFDFARGDDGNRRGGKFSPGLDLTIGTKERSVFGDPSADGFAAVGGHVEGGVKLSLDDGVLIGAGGEFYGVKGKADTAFIGDKEYGVTAGIEGKALSAGGFAGVQFDGKDKRIGATIGANLVSVEGSVGANIGGTNVSVAGEVGLKAELGFTVGKKGVEVKLPFISIGLKFGGGVD